MAPVSHIAVVVAATLLSASVAVHAQDALSAGDEPAPGDESAAAGALEELSAAYDALASLLNQGSGEAVERVQGDIENVGDWEYRVVALDDVSVEALEAELNRLGDERWEVFWVEQSGTATRFFLKRPAISYLGRVPVATLLRMLGGAVQ